MAITLDGTNGITTPALENDGVTTVAAGSASAPAITTDGDTNTGIFFPAADKPVTYTWKADGSVGQGFIAHELQEVVPDCVTGEKDAVNEDGSIKPQGIDTSFLVATLTAAIQELSAKNDALEARVAALEGAQA
jgi:hypothetical protein